MSASSLFGLVEKHRRCTNCALSTKRIANNEQVCIGTGMSDAIGLIIVPRPVYNEPDKPAMYGANTAELKMMKAIWAKSKINPNDWYHTTAVACRGSEQTPDNMNKYIAACNERLADTVLVISPKIVVCCGLESLNAFYMRDMTGTPKGWVNHPELASAFEVFYTYDFTKYIENKAADVPGWQDVAKEIMEHWNYIGARASEVSGKIIDSTPL